MRKGITDDYIKFVQSSSRALVGHLYQFTTIAGNNDYITDLDVDVTWNGQLWRAGLIRIEGLRRKTSVGLEVDEQSVKIYALPSETLFGANFLAAAENGLLDGCQITRYRAVWTVNTGNLLADVFAGTPQVWVMFTGYTSKIEKGGMTHLEMKVKSPLVKLEVNMPRNYYQPGCLWTLFDAGCTLNKAAFAVYGVVGPGVNSTTVPVVGGVSRVTGADGLPYYAQGRILFISGVNDGLLTLMTSNDASNLYLLYPLNAPPQIGDNFIYYPGCSKAHITCQAKFNNAIHFRGFDLVPPIAISI